MGSHKANLIRRELNKVEALPSWGRRQGDNWDRLSDFIYRVKTLKGLRRQARARAKAEGLNETDFEAYALRRWYNFHTHQQVFEMICAHPSVRKEPDSRHPTVDFYLRDLPFDLKLSAFPRNYPHPLDEAIANPGDLINWQYRNQSQQRRYHVENRLFVVFHNRTHPNDTWQLRRDFVRLECLLSDFLNTPRLIGADFVDKEGIQRRPWSGIIFCVAE
jgi:hypothetical protein